MLGEQILRFNNLTIELPKFEVRNCLFVSACNCERYNPHSLSTHDFNLFLMGGIMLINSSTTHWSFAGLVRYNEVIEHI